MILFIKHIDIEGPGTIAPYFEQHGYDIKIIELSAGDSLPQDLSGINGVVILGGPMNVYEEDKYPFLKNENAFIKKVLAEKIPMLGICLGSQLIAKAAGAQVSKAPQKEIGWTTVVLTEAGRNDRLFEGIEENFETFQWHEDTFEIPQDAEFLSTNETCKNQAFKVGEHAYGLQFHIEVTDDIIASWIKRYFKTASVHSTPEGKEMASRYKKIKNEFDKKAATVYRNFEAIINESNETKVSA